MKALHGGNIAEIARNCNIDKTSILDFSASINPLGISPAAKEAYLKAIDAVVHYPDNESYDLTMALSGYHSIPARNIITGNGSTELIYLIPRVLRPRKSLIITPSFSEYEASLTNVESEVDHFEVKEKESFRLDLSRFLTKLRCGYETVWIGNPGSPTGSLIGKDEMTEILKETKKLKIICIIDEAFMDFCESGSIKREVANFDNLIVLRSMTKFFALAGLRVGYIIGSEKIVDRLKRKKEPWSLSSPGQAAATASLTCVSYREESLKLIETEREDLYRRIKSLPFLTPYPSQTNFILAKLKKNIKSGELQKILLMNNHVLVRDCGNFQSLKGEFIRVAVKKRKENNLLLKALRNYNR